VSHQPIIDQLTRLGIRPSAQRVAIAAYVLATEEHPSADMVWSRVKATLPVVSRATVYNTLKLFVEKGLLQELVLAPGHSVYDPKVEPHHHFLDDISGAIHDVPFEAVQVSRVQELPGFEVRDYSVVLRGRRA
jgi:Fe2+ or Zn2+ uptake regulation protein